MGRMDSSLLSVRCTRSAQKSMVLMWLSAHGGRDVQGTIVIGGAVFRSLAVVAKKMESRVACARRFHCDGGTNCVAMASTHTGGLDRTSCCNWRQLSITSAKQFAASRSVDQRDH